MQLNNGSQFFTGVVEDRADPLMLGRVRARIVGLHTHDKIKLPTKDLPWSMLMQPASGGTGNSSIGPAEGTTVVVIFNDYPDCQQPIVLGQLCGIPQGDALNIDKFETPPIFKDDITPEGRPIPVTPAETDAAHVGPSTLPNPLATALAKSGKTNSTTGKSMLDSIFSPSSTKMNASGGLASSLNGPGDIAAETTNTFENLLHSSGNFDGAMKKLIGKAQEQGGAGAILAGYLNGKLPFPFEGGNNGK